MSYPLDRYRAGAFLVVALTALSQPTLASDPTPSPAEARLRADVGYLADDLRDGRSPGTAGIEASADYIAGVFRELGLKTAPGAEGYFQPFSIKGNPSLDNAAALAFKVKDKTIKGLLKTDFSPLALGESADLKDLPIVFAGYGITAKDNDAKLDYDDFAGIDVKGKAVLILRREPQQADEKSPFDGKEMSRYSDLRSKSTNAFQHGAKAILLVSDGVTAKDQDNLLPLGYAGGSEQSTSIPFVMLTRAMADGLLEAGGAPKLAAVEAQIDGDLKPRSKVLDGVTLTAKYAIDRKQIKTKNVIGVLEGSGPHAEETIFVGGHYDHLGHGGFLSGSLAMLSSDIHNGADDNASGTAMVLELARRLAKRPDPLQRRVVFMAFSGEEKGLLGSMYYVNHPLYPLTDSVFMLNFDMVGRLNDRDELTVFGIGSTPGAGELVEALGSSLGFKIKPIRGMADGIGGSDHQSFYQKKVPVLFAFTGVHSDYHRPVTTRIGSTSPGCHGSRISANCCCLTWSAVPSDPSSLALGARPRRTESNRLTLLSNQPAKHPKRRRSQPKIWPASRSVPIWDRSPTMMTRRQASSFPVSLREAPLKRVVSKAVILSSRSAASRSARSMTILRVSPSISRARRLRSK